MKKKEIILARIIATASAAALALLILLFGIGSGYFSSIARNINNNTFTGVEANLYNYYYYQGLHTIYIFLYTVTVMSLLSAILCIFFRLAKCQLVCTFAAISSMVTGLFLALARAYEASVGSHRLLAGFYMGNVSGSEIITSQYLPRVPVGTIALLVVSVVLLLLVRITKFDKIKLYQKSSINTVYLLLAGLYGPVLLEVLGNHVIGWVVSGMGAAQALSFTYVREYFVGEHWLVGIPLVSYAALALVLTIVMKNVVSQKLHRLISIAAPVLPAVVIAIYYFINPVRIFGVLTLEERICDITEHAMTWLLLERIAAVLFISTLIYFTYMKLSLQKLSILLIGNAIANIVFLYAGGMVFGLSGIYAGCVIANVGSAVLLMVSDKRLQK